MRRIAMTVGLTLAACSGEDKGGHTSSSAGSSGGQAQADPENVAGAARNRMVPVEPPSPTPIAAIPAPFQGRWGMVAADCPAANAAIAKGLMTVTADRLTFYESRGAATARQLAPGSIAVDVAMSGEGMTWSEPTRLTLRHDGRTLVREPAGSPDRAGAFTYQRCPA